MNGNQRRNAIQTALAAHDFANDHPFLVLGRRRTNNAIEGGTYPIGDDVAQRLREVAFDAFRKTQTRTMLAYDGYTPLDTEEGLWVLADRLRKNSAFIQFLNNVDPGEPLNADQATDLSLSFFAIGFGPDDARVYFVREKASNIRGNGKIMGLIDGPLHLITSPVLSLDTTIDFILTDAGAAVFSTHAFERFIQDPEEIADSVGADVDQLSNQLEFEPASLAAMKARGSTSLLTRGRIRSILARPYFATLTVSMVRRKMQAKGMDPKVFIVGNRLRFEAKDAMLLLKFLDQKVWRGDFDDTLYSTNAASPEDI